MIRASRIRHHGNIPRLIPCFEADYTVHVQTKRERLAQLMDRARVFDMILRARAVARAPVLSVLCYHSIGEPSLGYPFDPDVIDATPEQFREHLAVLRRHFTVIDIDALCAGIERGRWPVNPALITFDDGYRSCVNTALPILREFGFTATFFIATDYVTHRRLYWWDVINYVIRRSPRDRIQIAYPRIMDLDLRDRATAIQRLLRVVKDEYRLALDRFLGELAQASDVDFGPAIERALADQLVMTWDDVRTLRAAGMDIESHSRSHRVLQTLGTDALAEELMGSRTDIEREIGAPVRTIAYPVGYGIRNAPALEDAVVRAGYKLGFTSASGANYLWRPMDPLGLRRMNMMRELSMAMFRGLLAVPPLAYSRT